MSSLWNGKPLFNKKTAKNLTKMLSTEAFLADERRQHLVQQITEFCAVEESRFKSLCEPIILNLIHHAQSLPETVNTYYSQPGGFVDHTLNRTEAALDIFNHYVMASDKSAFSEEQKLWQYALLSAALLQGIGKLCVDFQVELYDVNSQFIKLWSPLLENLSDSGAYFLYQFQSEADSSYRQRLTLLLARLLMPNKGIAWLSSNHRVFAVWLALLQEDLYAAGTLGSILIRADALALHRYFNEKFAGFPAGAGRHKPLDRISTFSLPSENPPSEQTAIDFLRWLTQALEKGRFLINKAPLLFVPAGLVMNADLFKLFVREHPEFKNWLTIQQAVESLGMHQNDPKHGLVFKKYAMILPAEVPVCNSNSKEAELVSATDFIHQHQSQNVELLDKAGHWQTTENRQTKTSTLSAGITQSG